MNKALLSIGKMAALNRLSVSTLRLYDEKGLLKPRYIDPETGYRYYSIDQNARLDVIVYMKELGMGNDLYDLYDLDNGEAPLTPADAVRDVKPFTE